MIVKIWIQRDIYGRVIQADMDRSRLSLPDCAKFRKVGSWKQLVAAMLQTGSSAQLVDAAWRKAVSDGQIIASYSFDYGMPFDALTIQAARRDAETLDSYVSELVNNPRSKFYIYG